MLEADEEEAIKDCLGLVAQMRPVPEGFAPIYTVVGNRVMIRWCGGQFLNLGYDKVPNVVENVRLADELRGTAWGMIEGIRVGLLPQHFCDCCIEGHA